MAVAEAIKAEGASCTERLIPRPSTLIGRLACDQAGSSSEKWMLLMPLTIDLSISS